jgi:hypothetical protein
VVQEFALARRLIILVGSNSTSAKVVSKGISRGMTFCLFSGPEKLPEYYKNAGEMEFSSLCVW